MALEVTNFSLVQFKDQRIEDEKIPLKMMKTIDDKELYVPVVLRIGAIDYRLGSVQRVRRGREEIFGDLSLEMTASLEYELLRSEKGKVIGIKPKKVVYQR